MVTTPVSRMVSTTRGPCGGTSRDSRILASGSVGSAPAMSLPSGSICSGLPTTPRTTSGLVSGALNLSFGSSTCRLTRPDVCSRPSLTAYATAWGPPLSGARTLRRPSPSTELPSEVASTETVSLSRSRQSPMTWTGRSLPALTGYTEFASVAGPGRRCGGVFSCSPAMPTCTVASDFSGDVPLLTLYLNEKDWRRGSRGIATSTLWPSAATLTVTPSRSGLVTSDGLMARMAPVESLSLSSTWSFDVRPGRALRLSGSALGGWAVDASSMRFSSFLSFLSSFCGGGISDSQSSILTGLLSRSHTSPPSRSLRTTRRRLVRSETPSRSDAAPTRSMVTAGTACS